MKPDQRDGGAMPKLQPAAPTMDPEVEGVLDDLRAGMLRSEIAAKRGLGVSQIGAIGTYGRRFGLLPDSYHRSGTYLTKDDQRKGRRCIVGSPSGNANKTIVARIGASFLRSLGCERGSHVIVRLDDATDPPRLIVMKAESE